MQIRVKPMGVLRQRLGKQELVVELSDGSTLGTVARKIGVTRRNGSGDPG
jgi:molybdopterin converting factor small subunit